MKIIRCITATTFDLLALSVYFIALTFFFVRNIFDFLGKKLEKFADDTNQITCWIQGGDFIDKSKR